MSRRVHEDQALQVLRSVNFDTYRATLLMRDCKHLFRHRYFEPIMLLVSYSSPEYAGSLDTIVSQRDLLAFTFEDPEEMNLFLFKTRAEYGFQRVCAIHSRGGRLRGSKFVPDPTKKYLSDIIILPSPVKNYLIHKYNINQIVVGDREPEQADVVSSTTEN